MRLPTQTAERRRVNDPVQCVVCGQCHDSDGQREAERRSKAEVMKAVPVAPAVLRLMSFIRIHIPCRGEQEQPLTSDDDGLTETSAPLRICRPPT